MREGIELVRVTLGAADREPHPNLAGYVRAVFHRRDPVFLVVGAAFGVGHGVAVEGRGHPLGLGGVRQQIAGELFDGELVVGQIPVQGLDHPVAPRPDVRSQRVRAIPR